MLALGVIMLIGGIISAVFGNMQNNSLESQFNSFMSSGKVNPGDTFLYIGIAVAVIGLIFLIIGAVKKKK